MKKIILGIGLLVLGVSLGIGVMTYQPLLSGLIKSKLLSQFSRPIKVVDETEEKKEALAKFYNQISTAQDKQDWASMYELLPQSIQDNLSKDQFIAYEKTTAGKSKIVSQNTIVNSISVIGNNGTVDRTIVTCLTKECTGNNRQENNAKKQYEYVNGKWQIPDPKPSDTALEASSYIYINSSESEQKKLRDEWGYGSDTVSFTTRNLALFFDQNPDKLSLAEAWIDKNKAERSRPVVNYQPPAVIERPVIQQPDYPTHCTSNTIGSYTYTNCY